MASTAMMLVICDTRSRTALGERLRSRRRDSFSWKRGCEETRILGELGEFNFVILKDRLASDVFNPEVGWQISWTSK